MRRHGPALWLMALRTPYDADRKGWLNAGSGRAKSRRSVRLADETTAAAWRAERMIWATQMPLTLA
jgi:hypothetical protein